MYKKKVATERKICGIYQTVSSAIPPDEARNQMLLRCYFRVTFDFDLNAVFNPGCYIASENGQKRPNFGGDFLFVFPCGKAATSEYSGNFGRC